MLNFNFDWLPAGRTLPPGEVFKYERPCRTHDATIEDGEYYWVLFVYPPLSYESKPSFHWNGARFHARGPGKGFPAPGWTSERSSEGNGEAPTLEDAKAAVESWFVSSYTKAHT